MQAPNVSDFMPSTNWLAKFGTQRPVATLQSGSAAGSATVPDFELPDWLTTDPDNLMGEVMNEYGATGQHFNPAGVRKAYNQSINTAMGMGGQIADNAMREGMARSGQEGGSVNSSMLKAQAMLPVYEHTAGLKKDKALAVADMRAREAQMKAGLAQQMGSLRATYLSSLADTYMRGRGMNMAWQGQQFQQGMARDEFDLRRRLATLQSHGGGAPGGFSGQMTRSPNTAGSGGMEITPEFQQYLNATGQSAKAPQYPKESGILGGAGLDEYNAEYRQLLEMATGMPGYLFPTTDTMNASAMGGNWATDREGKYDASTEKFNGKNVRYPTYNPRTGRYE